MKDYPHYMFKEKNLISQVGEFAIVRVRARRFDALTWRIVQVRRMKAASAYPRSQEVLWNVYLSLKVCLARQVICESAGGLHDWVNTPWIWKTLAEIFTQDRVPPMGRYILSLKTLWDSQTFFPVGWEIGMLVFTMWTSGAYKVGNEIIKSFTAYSQLLWVSVKVLPVWWGVVSALVTVLIMWRSWNRAMPPAALKSEADWLSLSTPLMVILGSLGCSTITTASMLGIVIHVSSPKHLDQTKGNKEVRWRRKEQQAESPSTGWLKWHQNCVSLCCVTVRF